MTKFERHPKVRHTPTMMGAGFDRLVNSMDEYGQLDPILLFEGMVIDGWARLRACGDLKIEPRCVEWNGPGCPFTYVWEKNQTRLHLTPMQHSAALVLNKTELKKFARPDRDSAANSFVSLDAPCVGKQAAHSPAANEDVPFRHLQVVSSAKPAKHKKETAFIRLGDPLEFLESMQAQSADLLVTSTPGVEGSSHELAHRWLPLALSRLAPSARAYICTSSDPLELEIYLGLLSKQRDFSVESLLACMNPQGPRPASNQDRVRDWRVVLHLRGPSAPPLRKFESKAATFPRTPDALATRVIRESSTTGNLMVDPFAGDGTLLLVAAHLGRRALGCVSNETDLEVALQQGCARAE